MGDRTTVNLYVLHEHVEQAQKIIGYQSEEDPEELKILTELRYEEVNYGTLPNLDKLLDAGIPFESAWGNGSEYTSGVTYGRFNEQGESFEFDLDDDDHNPDINTLMALIDEPEKLIQFIQNKAASNTPLPWDNQAEYGKRHLLRRLVLPE